MYLDAQGTLWIGTVGGGLSRWRNGQFTAFTTREGLPDNTISQILEDDNGRLWLGSNRGIAGVSKAELDELAAGKIAVVYPQVYGRAEGMPSEECTGGFFPAGLKTKSGWLCFATLKGMVVMNPRLQKAAAPLPAVVLEETLIDGVAVDTPLLVRATAFGSTNEHSGPGGQSRPATGPAQNLPRLPLRLRLKARAAWSRLPFQRSKWARANAAWNFITPG